VWAAANLRNGGGLSRHEFDLAMRLIALGQAGQPVTREAVLQTSGAHVPPPRFEGVVVSPAASFATPGFGAAPSGGDTWAIGPADQAKYDAVFRNEDADADGKVAGKQAADLFVKSGLDKAVGAQMRSHCAEPKLKRGQWARGRGPVKPVLSPSHALQVMC
jgi:hypothetical protein